MPKQARPLLASEVLRLTEGLGPRDRALLWCMVGAGLRAAEAAALQVGDCGPDGSLTVRHGKGDQWRLVYLTGQGLEAVSQYRATLEDLSPTAPLFPSRKRRAGKASPMNPRSAVDLVKTRMEAAGLRNASSHSLRRTHAQALEEAGVSPRVIQRQLGHAQLNTTETYLAAYPPRHRDQVRGLEFRAT